MCQVKAIKLFVRRLVAKIFPEKIAKLYEKAEDGLWYIFFGVMTTLVNFLVYTLARYTFLASLFERNEALAAFYGNWVAWCVAVLAAFFFNRCFVFENKDRGSRISFQFFSFVALRLLSGVVENSTPSLLVKVFSMNDYWAKALVAVLVILLNYLFSKFITFRKHGNTDKIN